MKKVLLFGNTASGIYNFRKEIIDDFIQHNCEVYVIVPNDETTIKLEEQGVHFVSCNVNTLVKTSAFSPKEMKYIFKMISDISPDVILSYTIKPNILAGFYAKKHKNVKVIQNITGLGRAFSSNILMKMVALFLYKRSFKNTDSIVFQNKSDLAYIKSKVNKKTQDKLLLVSGSGINLTRFPFNKKENYPVKKIIYIGRLVRYKGIFDYLNVIEKLNNELNVSFYIAGSLYQGSQESITTQELDEIASNYDVTYLGVIDSNDMPKIYQEYDLVIVPSYTEGLCNTLLEANASGTLAMASNIPGCNDVLIDDKTGFMFEPGNINEIIEKMKYVINLDDNKKMTIVNNGRRNVEEHFDRKNVIQFYQNLVIH